MQKQSAPANESMLCTLHSYDANHQADNLVNWQQEYDQLSPGSFAGTIHEINFSHIHAFREDTNLGLRQQCRVEDGGLWLGFSANAKSCRINNERTVTDQLLCRPGSLDFELLTPDNFSIFGLVLHKSLFSEYANEANLQPICSITDELWLDTIDEQTLMTFRQYLTLLLTPAGSRWSQSTQEHILQDAVLELLSQVQPSSPIQVAPQQRQRIMARVHQYLTETRLKSPVTINELCQAVHVSRRTLQYTFNHCCDMSPKQYIQLIRLNQVRRALLNCEHDSIAEAAFDFGFFHLGQFSHDYKRLFGETPQQTRLREVIEV
ncbi:helix-turn-helix domain-containing protein [Echinimonas agarilytica]|uniref:Helix-turn-helix domain-containing protein n=1 Tax=Echinimonas agarilytica TaxID=1215918 RepID=A0AA41W795_9GAMM|nr:helix-turn-helix domain-containing protein [Echinimonas agarilytica]MCM2679739.1 helix-turn-helix domain-containing protein [Echinimonas agarilytica]